MKNDQIKIIVIVCVIALMFVSCFAFNCGDSGGDGKTSCKNCGRSPVYALGFCKSCYECFMDWHDKLD